MSARFQFAVIMFCVMFVVGWQISCGFRQNNTLSEFSECFSVDLLKMRYQEMSSAFYSIRALLRNMSNVFVLNHFFLFRKLIHNDLEWDTVQ